MVKQSYWVVDSAVYDRYHDIVKLQDNFGEGITTIKGDAALKAMYCYSPVARRNSTNQQKRGSSHHLKVIGFRLQIQERIPFMNSRIKNKMLLITLLPLILIGLVSIIVTSTQFLYFSKNEMKSQLKSTAETVNLSFDQLYSGEYYKKTDENGNEVLAKGDVVFNGRIEYFDVLKEQTGLEYTLFLDDTRIATTIQDNGNFIVGTTLDPEVINKLRAGASSEAIGVKINGTSYTAYYIALRDSGNGFVGVLGVAEPSANILSGQYKILIPIIAAIVVLLIITIIMITSYAKDITDCISNIRDFVNNITREKFSKRLSDRVYERDDELGEIGRDITVMRNVLHDLVLKDGLTELYNKQTGNNRFEAMRNKCRSNKKPYCLAIGDIDFFKKVNDTYGHDAGDAVLKEIAIILKKNMKGNGFVARWGGEEFMFGFENFTKEKAGKVLVKTLNEIRRTTIEYNEMIIDVTMTFGVVEGNEAKTVEDLFNLADSRLYMGKENGRNQIVIESIQEEK